MNESFFIFLAGLIGLFSAILKIAVEYKEKKDLPDAEYNKRLDNFQKAVASGSDDDITIAFEQLRRSANSRSSGISGSKETAEREL